MNYQRSQEQPETPDDYISLIQRYIGLAADLVRDPLGIEQSNKLIHPDLHLDNIFINPQTNRITSVIDWQHIAASPVCLHPLFPQMLEPSGIEEKEQKRLENQLLQFYLGKLESTEPQRWKILTAPSRSIRVEPILLVPSCWDREDLFSLRNSLITAIAHWPEIRPCDIECPINFTDDELEQHKSEMELIEGLAIILRQLQNEGLIPLGGMVPRDQYGTVQRWNNHFKDEFISLAEDGKQKELHAKLWPYS